MCVLLHGIALPFVALANFVGGEFTLTLLREPNAVSCVGVQIFDDRLLKDVENIDVDLQIPSDEAAVQSGPSTQAVIFTDM